MNSIRYWLSSKSEPRDCRSNSTPFDAQSPPSRGVARDEAEDCLPQREKIAAAQGRGGRTGESNEKARKRGEYELFLLWSSRSSRSAGCPRHRLWTLRRNSLLRLWHFTLRESCSAVRALSRELLPLLFVVPFKRAFETS